MKLKEIVSVWVERPLPMKAERAEIEESLLEAGFVRMRPKNGVSRFKRGSSVGGFDYDGEGLEVQLRLSEMDDGRLRVAVGNSGFPFEPLMMKPRFKRLADRIQSEVTQFGRLKVLAGEAAEVERKVVVIRNNAVRVALIVGAALMVVYMTRLWNERGEILCRPKIHCS